MNDLKEVVDALITLHLEPFLNNIWEEDPHRSKQAEDPLDYSIRPLMTCPDLQSALTDQKKNREVRNIEYLTK